MYFQFKKKNSNLIHEFLWQSQPDICMDCSIYVLSWLGEFTTGFLEKVFANLDDECDHNLSHGRYIRDKAKWANTEPMVEPAITDVCSHEFIVGNAMIWVQKPNMAYGSKHMTALLSGSILLVRAPQLCKEVLEEELVQAKSHTFALEDRFIPQVCNSLPEV